MTEITVETIQDLIEDLINLFDTEIYFIGDSKSKKEQNVKQYLEDAKYYILKAKEEIRK